MVERAGQSPRISMRAHPGTLSRATACILFAAVLALVGCSPAGTPDRPTQPPLGPPASTTASVVINEDLTARQVFPITNWWNLDVSQAPVDPTRRRSSTGSAGARRRIPRRPAACIRTSGRRPTAFPTSSSPAINRACR